MIHTGDREIRSVCGGLPEHNAGELACTLMVNHTKSCMNKPWPKAQNNHILAYSGLKNLIFSSFTELEISDHGLICYGQYGVTRDIGSRE